MKCQRNLNCSANRVRETVRRLARRLNSVRSATHSHTRPPAVGNRKHQNLCVNDRNGTERAKKMRMTSSRLIRVADAKGSKGDGDRKRTQWAKPHSNVKKCREYVRNVFDARCCTQASPLRSPVCSTCSSFQYNSYLSGAAALLKYAHNVCCWSGLSIDRQRVCVRNKELRAIGMKNMRTTQREKKRHRSTHTINR